MTEDAIISLVLGILGGGISQVLQAWTSHCKGVREHDVAHDQHALNALVTTVETLRAEVKRQVADREEDRKRMRCLEKSNETLARDNRTFREVITSVLERLSRKPPDTPESILAYILSRLPHLGKDPS